ncbi:MAG: right-handed parallel beta-helix repeat-containing protein, partial [Candidatus Cryptobacteroides sp.]|nr:right-handed parallel beta-helix repeat-containing protein [Candidatus Cryptobacteroides sp.]
NTLAMNYLFAPETEQIILPSVKMTAKLTEVVDFEVSNVPAKRNYRTNVIGNLLSEQTDFTITVDANWNTPEIEGPVPGYMGAVLPAAPVVVGNVMTVNTENAQYALDGAYGSIDGMTIHFSAGTYPQLIFGRPNKYPGSHTIYRHTNFDNTPMSYEEIVAYKSQSTWTANCYYERSISNVTFTAESGAELTGMTFHAGAHVYGTTANPVYDYVLDNGTKITDTNKSYYQKLVASNIKYDGITFKAVDAYKPLDISSSSAVSVIDGVKVLNCHFIGTSKEGKDNQAIRFYTENQSGAAGTEGKVVRNLVVKNTTINNFHQGIYTNGAYGVTVEGCHISNTGHNAIALQSISAAVNLGQVKILSNTFENIGDRIIRLGNVAAGSSFTITGNVATNSGDDHGQVLKAETLAAEGITYDIHSNNWGEGKIVFNEQFVDAN